MAIKTRRDLYNLLEKRMRSTYEKLKEDQELEYGENMLKTYILESTLDSIHSLQKNIGGYKVRIFKTQDKTLYEMKVYKGDEPHSTFFVDTSDPRFWILHTLSRSDKTDQFMNRLVFSVSNNIDFPWFNTYFLENLVKNEIFRGFTLKFEEKIVDDERLPVKSLSMRLWGDAAPKILEALRSHSSLRYSTALSGIGLKHFFDSDGDFVIENITFNAKFTSRGTTIDGHMFIVRKVLEKYKNELKTIEQNSIRYEESEIGYKVYGEPAIIEFQKEIENLEVLLDKILSSTKPFRLWGLKTKIGRDYYKAVCVDLHTGHKLTIEVSPEWMRIYLPYGACGNTVMRLLTNIQQYYDSGAKLVRGDEAI